MKKGSPMRAEKGGSDPAPYIRQIMKQQARQGLLFFCCEGMKAQTFICRARIYRFFSVYVSFPFPPAAARGYPFLFGIRADFLDPPDDLPAEHHRQQRPAQLCQGDVAD